jgi:two-component system OmpR family response regulator
VNKLNASARILLIEDDVALGTVTSEVLKHLGHDVHWSPSVSEAFASLSGGQQFAAVLLDLGLGPDDGVSLVLDLRAGGYRLPPLLVFSAQPIDVLRRAADTTGAVAVLQKPCSASELDNALQRALRAH